MDSDILAAGGCDPPIDATADAHGAAPDFRTVYRELYHPVADYVLRRTGCAHATEDLLGDVFLSVLRALSRFAPRGTPVRHWVFRIANHRVHRWLRRRRSETNALAVRAEQARREEHAAVVAGGRDAAERAARDTARAALASLPRRLQEVAALHYLAGLPLDEVAATLRVPLGTAKSRLSRALTAMRERLPQEERP